MNGIIVIAIFNKTYKIYASCKDKEYNQKE